MSTCRRHALALVLAALVATVACGGSDGPPSAAGPSPVETGTPAAPPPAPTTSGATISGTVTSGSASHAGVRQVLAVAGGLSGVLVSVEGTDLATTTGPGGGFELHGVPSGRVRVRFQGSGVSGTLELTDVSQNEAISLAVVVSGSAIEVESQERVTGSQSQLEGKVTSADYGSRTFVVGTTTLVVPDGTPITNGYRDLAVTDIVVGARLHAMGSKSGDTLTATRVTVQQTGLERVTLTGLLSDLGGTCPDATFKFGSVVIAVNSSTIFVRGTCADLKSGVALEVRGLRRTDGSVLATMARFTSNGDDDDENGTPVEIAGVISALGGTCPARTFRLGDREVRTTGATTFLTPCATLANGQAVEVRGRATGSGTVHASQVQ